MEKFTLEQLQERWPLYRVIDDEDKDYFVVRCSDTRSNIISKVISRQVDKNNVSQCLKYRTTLAGLRDIDHEHAEDLRDLNIEKKFPNLRISNGHVWIRTEGINTGTGFTFPPNLFGLDGTRTLTTVLVSPDPLYRDHAKRLARLNEEATLAVKNPEQYFWCTECDKSLPKTEYQDFVFAGVYCISCSKKPTLARFIRNSKRPGFYD